MKNEQYKIIPIIHGHWDRAEKEVNNYALQGYVVVGVGTDCVVMELIVNEQQEEPKE